MHNLSLTTQYNTNATLISNTFIDQYMPQANGEFVKIYLYLLRSVYGQRNDISVSGLADEFNQTEADVMRALRYWNKTGAIIMSFDGPGNDLSGITFCDLTSSEPQPAPDTDYIVKSKEMKATKSNADVTLLNIESKPETKQKKSYSAAKIKELKNQEDFSLLLYVAGTYLGGTLSPAEASTIAYMYDALQFPADLIEYLIEYCVSRDHKSMRYIEKVALYWNDAGIKTVKQAKHEVSNHSDITYTVINAFGIANRELGMQEREYIKKWSEKFNLNNEIILEACNRTIKVTHQPSFEYADSILTKWYNSGIRNLDDIAKADAVYEQNRNLKRNSNSAVKTVNRFNNFHQRDTDIDSLESSLISNNG